MSRARDMANLGAQAGSGLDASDLTTGTLGNTVQDNITRLGTVTTGTFNGTIGGSATFPSGKVIKFSYSNDVNYADISANNTFTYDADGTGFTVTCTAGNTLFAIVEGGYGRQGSTSGEYGFYGISFSPNTGGNTNVFGQALFHRHNSNYTHWSSVVSGGYTVPSGVTSVEILRVLYSPNTTNTMYWGPTGSTTEIYGRIKVSVWEIQA